VTDSLISCASCRFHDLQDVAAPDGTPIIGEQRMICRRLPPNVLALPVPQPGGMAINIIPMFPPVTADMWCHEFDAENGAQDALN